MRPPTPARPQALRDRPLPGDRIAQRNGRCPARPWTSAPPIASANRDRHRREGAWSRRRRPAFGTVAPRSWRHPGWSRRASGPSSRIARPPRRRARSCVDSGRNAPSPSPSPAILLGASLVSVTAGHPATATGASGSVGSIASTGGTGGTPVQAPRRGSPSVAAPTRKSSTPSTGWRRQATSSNAAAARSGSASAPSSSGRPIRNTTAGFERRPRAMAPSRMPSRSTSRARSPRTAPWSSRSPSTRPSPMAATWSRPTPSRPATRCPGSRPSTASR